MDFAFIDSGMGGIPYMIRLLNMKTGHSAVYLADTAAFPYGTKSPQEVTDCALRIVGQAIKVWHPAVMVVACNTMSVHALHALRAAFTTPIVGTVPAIRLAAGVTRNGRIGFLATDATVAAEYSQELTRNYAADCTVFPLGAPDLVRFVEERIATATEDEKADAVRPSVEYFAHLGCDTIILGCTHFTHLADTMERVAQSLIPDVRVVDSRDGVARQALKVWGEAASRHCAPRYASLLGDPDSAEATPSVYVTGAETAVWARLCAALGLEWKGTLPSYGVVE